MTGVLIEGENAYPIYSVGATWIDDEKHPEYRGPRDACLPVGKCFNGTGFDLMKPAVMTEQEQSAFLQEWWEGYKAEKDEKGVWLLPKLAIKYVRHEVWCLTWFSHFTFDDGRSDREFLESFERYVERIERLNTRSQREAGKDAFCLMGAEDRWRWRNSDDDRDNPVCRCDGCKAQGVVRINH